MVDPDDRQRASAAEAALADIERQQVFVTQRLGVFVLPPPVVAVVLAIAAASLAYRNGVLFVVVLVIYLAAFIPLLGTPIRAGVIPREGRQSRRPVFALCVVLLSVPSLAMLGPWWTAIVAGAVAGVAVVVLSRWRLATTIAEARRPPLVDDNQQKHAFTDRIVAIPAVIVTAVMGAGVLAATSPDRVLGSLGFLAYFLGVGTLFVAQRRIVAQRQRVWGLPPEIQKVSVGLALKGLLLGVALWAPVMLTTFFESLRGNVWVASCCALGAVLTAATISGWQHHTLRHQARTAGSTSPDGANG